MTIDIGAIEGGAVAGEHYGGGNHDERRRIVTPEGVALTVRLAGIGDRFGALLIDLLLIVAVAIALVALCVALSLVTRSFTFLAPLVLFFFLGSNAYFTIFELQWQGATPGKRWVGLRVIDRRGGPLTPQAIVARNLMRSLELFLPMGTMLAAGAGGWGTVSLLGWLLVFALMPVFNRDRQRCGDMIAGTWVIVMPKPALGAELLQAPERFSFSNAQLEAYGEREVQVLEELLRREPERKKSPQPDSIRTPEDHERVLIHRDIGTRIRRKIGWAAPVGPEDEETFLRDFYSAQRAYLEFKTVTTGRRRRTKNDGRPAARGEPRGSGSIEH